MTDNQPYRFSLDKSSKKYFCPNCGKKSLVIYIDQISLKPISKTCGRCDRENSCGYHLPPKKYWKENPKAEDFEANLFSKPKPEKPINYLPKNYLSRSKTAYSNNNFFIWLSNIFDPKLVLEILEQYHVGTSKKWQGSTVFWQVDTKQKVRQAKVILYNKETGKRDRKKGCFFAGKKIARQMGISDPKLKQCFFGQHLVSSNKKVIGIVESEKTAIIMAILSRLNIVPSFLFLATGGKAGCKWYEKSVNNFLANKEVVIFPDLGAFEQWKEKSTFLKAKQVIVSDTIQKIGTDQDRKNGLDIADYLLEDLVHLTSKEIKVKSKNEITIDKMKAQNQHIEQLIETFALIAK